jgi:hypothetical protein
MAHDRRCWFTMTTLNGNTPTAPRGGLPETKVGTFDQPLTDEAKSRGWTVISMKTGWKRIFAFE